MSVPDSGANRVGPGWLYLKKIASKEDLSNWPLNCLENSRPQGHGWVRVPHLPPVSPELSVDKRPCIISARIIGEGMYNGL